MEKTLKAPTRVIIKGQEWTADRVKQLISTNDQAVKNALLRVYSWQTQDEQQAEETRESNGKGFNGLDSRILSSFAEQLKERGFLSPKQIAIARKKLLKYSRQIFLLQVAPQHTNLVTKFGLW